ncbi:sensor histidine kinase [Roseibium algae]|uniref:ATP-binding protein n=1 Tax=Roseibium algae TaxID=3123038 RepID=A0ABU8TRY1_9HYPH
MTALGSSLVTVIGLMAVFIAIPTEPYPDIDGAIKITSAQVCRLSGDSCDQKIAPQNVTLPYYIKPNIHSGIHSARFTFFFDMTAGPDDVTAIYLPKFSDAVSVHVNGVAVTRKQPADEQALLFHSWHRPALSIVPNVVLNRNDNLVSVDLSADYFNNLSLFPVYIGDAAALDFAHQVRLILRVGMARVNFALAILAGFSVLFFWLFRRRDHKFLWLMAANFSVSAVCFHWVYPNFLYDYRIWVVLWNATIGLFAWCLLGFTASLISARLQAFQLGVLAGLFAGICVLVLLPDEEFATGLAGYQLLCLCLGLFVLAVLVAKREKTSWLNFSVLFGLYAIALTLTSIEWLSQYVWPNFVSIMTTPLIPVTYFLGLLWIIFYQLAAALQQYEKLTITLQSTVDQKSQELRESYEKLNAQTQRQAIDEERQRILLDLHDGIGGQLVNTLAYMASQPDQDVVLQTALENALSDMGLMIDSLEANDSISTQLGMLRGRLSPLLDKHHIALKWEVDEEPVLSVAGPSHNLSLLRIVQEAITNAIKHSKASTITVATERCSISVTDNGHGFDLEPVAGRSRTQGHIGLMGMKRRAKSIPATLEISSSNIGSKVTLCWEMSDNAGDNAN